MLWNGGSADDDDPQVSIKRQIESPESDSGSFNEGGFPSTVGMKLHSICGGELLMSSGGRDFGSATESSSSCESGKKGRSVFVVCI